MDLLKGTQNAVFGALAAAIGADWPVYDTVPQGAEPPFTLIGKIEFSNQSGKSDQLERFNVEVQNIYRGEDRNVLLGMMHRSRVAIAPYGDEAGQELAADGVSFGPPHHVGGIASDAGPDGVTYAGINTFEIEAEPA